MIRRPGGSQTGRDDTGFGLVEVVIALAILALIIVPLTRLIVTTESASNTQHLHAEAADLATQALETAQYQTANGVNPTSGITKTTQVSGKDPFTVAVDFELVAGTGTSSSICIASAGQPSSRIWSVKATVSWGQGGQGGKVVESTLVSPALADLADVNAAEIAVPIYNADDSTLETAMAISITVTGSCAGTQCSGEQVPSNEVTSESGNTGSSGCAVFPDLFAGAGWTYNITASPPPPYVDPNELFYNLPTAGVQIWSNVSVQSNQVTVADNPHLILAPGASTKVEFQTVAFAVTNASTVNNSATVTVAAGGFPGVAAGMGISGTGVAAGTTVANVVGNTLTLSASATATGTVTLTFSGPLAGVLPAAYLPISVQSSTLLCSTLGAETCVLGNGTVAEGFSSAAPQAALLYPGPATNPNYSAWTGDQADSEPSAYGAVATNFQASPGVAGTLQLPVYALTLTVTGGPVTAFTATDYGGGDTLTLNGTSGAVATGLPLGQFQIQAANGATNEPVTLKGQSSSGVFVWITPTGVCVNQTPLTSPCPQSAMVTGAISVSAA